MAYRNGERYQMGLFPPSIENYVGREDPVRAYDAFVEALDFRELGIELNSGKVGNPEYHPKAMVKLLIYGTSYGWKGSRKLERATHHNVAFIWLMGGLRPDHKTISEFRRKNKKALRKAFKHCVRMCIELDLIDGNVLFVDGTKIRANAARSKNYTQEHYEDYVSKLDERIKHLLDEGERIDEEEDNQASLIKMKKELADSEQLRTRIKDILHQFKEHKDEKGKAPRRINQTDPESALMNSVQGSHASYNVQSVVDDKHGLIVHVDTVQDTSDVNQFAEQITQAEEVLEQECKVACADAGYADTEELERIDRRGTQVIVPSQRQALHQAEGPFSKSAFTYDKEQNCYYCPEGHKLPYRGKQDKGKKLAYRIRDAATCKQCKNYEICTSAKRGRKIVRLVNEEIKEKLEQQYEQVESQEIYARRKTRVEHPFGHLKQNLKITNFLLRGQEGTQTEAAIGATCFNIVRMITLAGGIQEFIAQIVALQGVQFW